MRPSRGRSFPPLGRQLLFHSRDLICPPQLISRAFVNWPPGPCQPGPQTFLPSNIPRQPFQRLVTDRLSLIRAEPTYARNLRTAWKKGRGTLRSRFRPRKRLRRGIKSKAVLNPTDPLNLQDLMKETERRRVEGLSPLRGDSRLNTPAVSTAGNMGNESPQVLGLTNSDPKNAGDINRIRSGSVLRQLSRSHIRTASVRNARHMKRWQKGKNLAITGNYRNYYFRRDPNDRLPYLMPEWFSGKDVADYGCHNGTLTFGVLERFPDVRRIDAIDCDAELIANARSMQRERLRWSSGSNVQYDKINFQVGNWIDTSTPTEEPEYDTIMAFSVTKWIHLNYGDAGLMRFFRRAFNLLKPGGHLILEPQPKTSYRRTRFTAKQRSIYQSLKIDPVNLEPLLVDLGFSYFDTIKFPRPNEPFRRTIILCSKSYGATPASIRNNSRSEFLGWRTSPSQLSPTNPEPPPVYYHPQTPMYLPITPIPASTHSDSPASGDRQAYVVTSSEAAPSTDLSCDLSAKDPVSEHYEPDSTSVP
ncbi:unnamed protein product [Calicophoron daubneyi]|uniref:RNA methyltransferase n=1 Tax=Calicophoron daubneyi TaxID=300641 RepID=A0AAV2TKW8_CALDB